MEYTKVNYKKLWQEIENLDAYSNEITNNQPDECSEVWQIAVQMEKALAMIKQRASRKEQEFSKI
jgi:hypothetical protein